jgi:hypothetical protein
MREERAAAWEAGYEQGHDAGSGNGPEVRGNPHR